MVTTRSERSGDSRARSEDTECSSSAASTTSPMRLRSRSQKTDEETEDAVVDKKSVIGGRQHLQRSAKDKVYAEKLLVTQSSRRALVS